MGRKPDFDKKKFKELYKKSWNKARVTPHYPMDQYWKPILEGMGLPTEDWQLVEKQLVSQFKPWWQMFGVVERVSQAGYRVGIISNHICAWFDHWFERFGLSKLFEEPELVVISSRLQMAKPDKQVFVKYCASTGLEAAECVFVDNTQENVDAAVAAGWKGVFFAHKDKDGQVVEQPEALIEKLRACGVAIP